VCSCSIVCCQCCVLTDLASIAFVGKKPAHLQGIGVRDAKPPHKRLRVFSPGTSIEEYQADYDAVCGELRRLRAQIKVYREEEAAMVVRQDKLSRPMEGGKEGLEELEDEVEEA
jgi:hypothetical protein